MQGSRSRRRATARRWRRGWGPCQSSP
jgi:hypothetical protein